MTSIVLPNWSDNFSDQQFFIDVLKTNLTNIYNEHIQKNRQTIILNQDTRPTQDQWETEWVLITGLPLPILPSAELIWVKGSAIHDILRFINGSLVSIRTMTPQKSVYMLSSTGGNNSPVTNSTQSFLTPVATLGTNINIKVPTTIELAFSTALVVNTAPSPTTNLFGADFFANGQKLSTTYYAQSTTSPWMFLGNTTTFINIWMIIPNLNPGSYTFQVGVGNSGTPSVAGNFTLGPGWTGSVKGYRL